MSRVLDSVYRRLGKPAEYRAASGEPPTAVRVIDETRGRAVEAAQGAGWDIQPRVRVRAYELPDDFGLLTIAGTTWKIVDARPYLAPSGGVTEELDVTLRRIS